MAAAGYKTARRGFITTVVVALVVAAVVALPTQVGAVTMPKATPSHKTNGIPAGLAQAIHARFGPGPIGLGHAPLVSGIVASRGGWSVRTQSLSAHLSTSGDASVSLNGAAAVTLRASSLRAGSSISPLRVSSSKLSNSDLIQDLGRVSSSELVTKAGLEQRFVIAQAPKTDNSTLTVDLVSTNRWKVVRDASAVQAVGTDVLYGGLRSIDAKGHVLLSHFVVTPSGAGIVVDIHDATFPLVIDPTWTSQTTPTATLLNNAGVSGNTFGIAVALSADDTIALVGAGHMPIQASNNASYLDAGAAYIYRSSGSSWSTSAVPTATLTDPVLAEYTYFGASVALSGDGTTAFVGCAENASTDVVYVFRVSKESKWKTTDKPKATLSDGGSKSDGFGSSLALSSKGTTAVIGAPFGTGEQYSYAGDAYVFSVAAEADWATTSKPSATLTDSAYKKNDYWIGYATGVSSDGTTAIVGTKANVALIYHVSSATKWVTTKKPTSTLTNGVEGSDFGTAVALSSDGTTALVGSYEATVASNGDTGAAYVFHASSESTWSATPTASATLTNPNLYSSDSFGSTVSLAASGTTALIGDPSANGSLGAAYIFHSSSERAWSSSLTPAATLSDSSDQVDSALGSPVLLSSDGTTAVADIEGNVYDTGVSGKVDIFSSSSQSAWSSAANPSASLTLAGNSSPFGYSVAISADGTTALVGNIRQQDPSVGNLVYYVYVFHVSSEGAWTSTTTSVAQLSNYVAADDFFGDSVALSSDGTTAFVGDIGLNSDNGAVYVYHVSSESAWSSTTPTPAVLSVASKTGDFIGWGISVSTNGTTALIGNGIFDSADDDCAESMVGSAFIFHVSSESSWVTTSTPTAILSNSVSTASDCFGASVSLSGDGTTALVGAFEAGSSAGAAYIYNVSSQSSWTSMTKPQATLTDANASWFGWSIALSSDGTTALIGAPATSYDYFGEEQAYTGAAYVFNVSKETGWATTATPLATLSDAAIYYYTTFGMSVGFDGAGTTAYVCGDYCGSTGGPGAVFVFTASSESTWATNSAPTVALSNSAQTGPDAFGWALAPSSDGTTLLVGAYIPGSAYIYSDSGS